MTDVQYVAVSKAKHRRRWCSCMPNVNTKLMDNDKVEQDREYTETESIDTDSTSETEF